MQGKKEATSATKSSEAAAGSSSFSRRDLLKGSLAAGVVGGVGLGSVYFGYSAVREPIRVGVIGTGDEGGVLMGAINPDYVQVVAIADIRPYNVYRAFHGDESSENALKHRPGLITKYGYPDEATARRQVRVYQNGYEELLNDPNVEGVIIALPLHLHAEASIKAMRAGKDVLCEKLMAHSVHQCKEMALVAEQQDRILAVGHQRHYSILYDNAKQLIRRGMIGDLHHIRAQWHRGNMPGKDSWQPPLPGEPMQAKLSSYDAKSKQLFERLAALTADDPQAWNSSWGDERYKVEKARRLLELRMRDLGVPAEKFGYADFQLEDGTEISALQELIQWRLWNRTGGGLMAELGSHQLDAASIFISALRENEEKVNPLMVYGIGGRQLFPLDREVDDHVYCAFEFPAADYESDPQNNRIVVTYSSINGNGFGGYGEVVMGTKGTLVIEREQDMELIPSDSASTYVQAGKSGGPTLDTTESGAPMAAGGTSSAAPVSRGYKEEIEHWAWCMRNRDPQNMPRCGPSRALADAVMALVANKAMQEERKVEFQPEWFEVANKETPEGIAPDVSRKEYKI